MKIKQHDMNLVLNFDILEDFNMSIHMKKLMI